MCGVGWGGGGWGGGSGSSRLLHTGGATPPQEYMPAPYLQRELLAQQLPLLQVPADVAQLHSHLVAALALGLARVQRLLCQPAGATAQCCSG